jgi:hypothetical protein
MIHCLPHFLQSQVVMMQMINSSTTVFVKHSEAKLSSVSTARVILSDIIYISSKCTHPQLSSQEKKRCFIFLEHTKNLRANLNDRFGAKCQIIGPVSLDKELTSNNHKNNKISSKYLTFALTFSNDAGLIREKHIRNTSCKATNT